MPCACWVENSALAARECRVVEFFYADPRADVVAAAHDAGAIAGWQVGSPAEAVAAEKAGCDYIVAQGTEAGGHVRGGQSLDQGLPPGLLSVGIPAGSGGGDADAGAAGPAPSARARSSRAGL